MQAGNSADLAPPPGTSPAEGEKEEKKPSAEAPEQRDLYVRAQRRKLPDERKELNSKMARMAIQRSSNQSSRRFRLFRNCGGESFGMRRGLTDRRAFPNDSARESLEWLKFIVATTQQGTGCAPDVNATADTQTRFILGL